MARVALQEQERRTLKVNVACMSRAGREPGFKKTNQDNCFAFEKYITEDQSLFGAMDGHGPHGEAQRSQGPSTPYSARVTYIYVYISQVAGGKCVRAG